MWSELDSNYRLLNIVSNSVVEPVALELFYKNFSDSLSKADRLQKNYSLEKFDIAGHLMFDALYNQENQLVACAGIYHREGWPVDTYRLLNRTYFMPQFRDQYQFHFFASDYILPFQIQACSFDLKFSFVSREGVYAGHFLKKLQARPFFKKHYQISEQYIQVVPGVFDKVSFQKILFFNKTQTPNHFLGVKDIRAPIENNLLNLVL
jgi:hypothetical protein